MFLADLHLQKLILMASRHCIGLEQELCSRSLGETPDPGAGARFRTIDAIHISGVSLSIPVYTLSFQPLLGNIIFHLELLSWF